MCKHYYLIIYTYSNKNFHCRPFIIWKKSHIPTYYLHSHIENSPLRFRSNKKKCIHSTIANVPMGSISHYISHSHWIPSSRVTVTCIGHHHFPRSNIGRGNGSVVLTRIWPISPLCTMSFFISLICDMRDRSFYVSGWNGRSRMAHKRCWSWWNLYNVSFVKLVRLRTMRNGRTLCLWLFIKIWIFPFHCLRFYIPSYSWRYQLFS